MPTIRLSYVIVSLALVVGLLIAQALLAGDQDSQAEQGVIQDSIAQAQEQNAEGDEAMTNEAGPGEYRELTPEEEEVIIRKGTEAPFSGEYHDHFAEGVYTCRRCGAMLYTSNDKFRSDCGWPSFDDELPAAVKRTPDADGRRTEITCANCGGHLGHVFLNEGFTEKNTRHCVNSLSMNFLPADEIKYGRAIFAAGCFWGVEYYLQTQPGVLQTTVGYIGGSTEKPTYEQVSSHTTGHAEAVEVYYDPVRISFEQLAKIFFELHDPTQVDGQGPDIGSQYRSEIFYTDQEQEKIAHKLIAELEGRGMKIATRVSPAGRFWPGEEYHQDWFMKKGQPAACHARQKLW